MSAAPPKRDDQAGADVFERLAAEGFELMLARAVDPCMRCRHAEEFEGQPLVYWCRAIHCAVPYNGHCRRWESTEAAPVKAPSSSPKARKPRAS